MTDGPDASPRLIWSDDGSPRSGRFGDVYFSKEDGLAESRAVFLAGCGLPHAWAGRRRFTVAELGFGTGLNIAALLDLWRRTRPAEGHLQVFTIEGFPLTASEAGRALSAWPEIADAATALLESWPEGTPGFHRLDLPEWNATIDVAVGDVAWALAQWGGRADAWFLDGFAPSTNPQMWSDAVLDGVAARSAPGARVATFTVAGTVRRGLAERGFTVEKQPGHGRKRERLEAHAAGEREPEALPPRVAVIGAGIAGAALARALRSAGAGVTVIEAERPGAGGSGFPAALVTPRLDAGDAVIAGLHAQALEVAVGAYRAVEGAVLAQGVLQLEQTPRDAGRFTRIAAQTWWSEDQMTVVDAAGCSARLGEPVEGTGLWMGGAAAIAPARVLEAWLEGVDRLTLCVEHLEYRDGVWTLQNAAGEAVFEAERVILASGWGTAGLVPTLALAPVRGQADWIEGGMSPAIAWGGYAVPTGSGVLFGATHERGETEPVVTEEASARNRDTLAGRLPGLAGQLTGKGQSRAAIRATTPDRLPLAGAIPGREGLYVLGGLGSRGFCLAPLLAGHLAALVTAASSPMPRDHAVRLDPARFWPEP
ncbi:tRNA (5-methylaminomethyl-2-thiouridine)(34)-methyltransferase MnmD [Rhizobium sp. CRIBSB]|nr:tRNA (5-methylaminomethyl-2-thiouridine)(34)-methyltransferase MnmD [Rhizobium sp. CRIBSB]